MSQRSFHRGWQHEASSLVDRQFRDGDLIGRLDDTAKTLTRSHSGSGSHTVGTVDTTLVCTLHPNGSAPRGAAHIDGGPHSCRRADRPLMRRRVEQTWRFRWGALLSCSVAELWQCRCWSGRGLEVRMALVRPLMRWNVLACSLVSLSKSGRFLAGAFLCSLVDGLCFVFEISFQLWLS